MKITKKVHKRSKKVLGRKPESSFYVREIQTIEDYPGHKVKIERLMTVDDFTNGNRAYKT